MTEKTLKAYVADSDSHDGIINHVRQELNGVSVEVVGCSGARCLVRFSEVESVTTHDPEGMVLYAFAEVDTESRLHEFVFANSREPNEEGGDSILEITAQSFNVQRI